MSTADAFARHAFCTWKMKQKKSISSSKMCNQYIKKWISSSYIEDWQSLRWYPIWRLPRRSRYRYDNYSEVTANRCWTKIVWLFKLKYLRPILVLGQVYPRISYLIPHGLHYKYVYNIIVVYLLLDLPILCALVFILGYWVIFYEVYQKKLIRSPMVSFDVTPSHSHWHNDLFFV